MLFDDVLQCAIPTYFFSFSMFFIYTCTIYSPGSIHKTHINLSIQDSCFTKNNTLMIVSQEDLDVTLMLKNVSFIENINDASISLYLVGLTNTTIDSCEMWVTHHFFWLTLSMCRLKGTQHL